MTWPATFIDRLFRRTRRSLRFTALGTKFVLVTLAVGMAAINTGNNLLYLVLAMLLSMITLSGVLSEQCLRRLSAVRRLPSVIFAGERVTATIAVTNHNRIFPSFLLHIDEAATDAAEPQVVPGAGAPPIFVLPPQTSRSVPTRALFDRRGRHRLHGVVASTKFPFGLFTKRLMIPLPQEVLVYPALLPNIDMIGVVNPVGQELEIARRGHGSGLFVLRDYVEGDDARTIHWKKSARQGKLMVREADEEEHRAVTLVVDGAWPGMTAGERELALYQARFERAVSLAASLAVEWNRQGWRLGLLADATHLPPAHGTVHLGRLLRTLALLPPLTRPRVPARGSGTSPPRTPVAGNAAAAALDGGDALPTEASFPAAPTPRQPDDMWVILHISRETSWSTGFPRVLRRLVTCPNEPTAADQTED